MTPVTAPTLVAISSRLPAAATRVRLVALVRRDGPLQPPARSRRRRAAQVVLLFAGLIALTHGTFGAWLDYGPPRVRDPEYGIRLAALRARTAESPRRPLVLCLGSSRTAMGVSPAVLDTAPDRPLLFNFSLVGSGPVMELMAYRRAMADGVRPAAVLIEYWPAFLMEVGPYHEAARFDPSRLRPVDMAAAREFFPDPPATARAVRDRQLSPVFGHRQSLQNQLVPSLVPATARTDALRAGIDGWGWLPGRVSVATDEAAKIRASVAAYYDPLFAAYEVSPVADRALRQLVAECRVDGVKPVLVYLPESPAFRAHVPPAAARLGDAHLSRLTAELAVPLIDARGWAADANLPDGFHLTQSGAAAFTKRLAAAVDATLPDLSPAPAARP